MSTYVVGDVLAGKYEIKAVLGAGGMGTVYRARQMDLGRDVAIKVPMAAALEIPGFLTRFSREARLVAKLVHDNIVQVYEYQESQDGVYIVMEYVEGQDMKALLTKPPADLKVKDVAAMLRASCEGLAHAHEGGIVHRDIKPHNIMVAQTSRGRWRVKIMDFGIAHMDANANLTMAGQGGEQLTVTGQAIGTPSYMSPEQIRGSGVSHKSDIYSMGCVIYYSFTRLTPFSGTGFTVAAAHLSEAAPMIRARVPQLPAAVEAIITRCLEKDPANRPDDASHLGEELYRALEPIFDLSMADLWPGAQQEIGGTEGLRPTAAPEATIGATVTGDEDGPTMGSGTGAKTVMVRDNAPIPAPGPGAARAAKDATRTSATQTAPQALTDATIPYAPPGSLSSASVPVGESTPPPVAPRRNMAVILAAVLIPVFLTGVVGAVIWKNQVARRKAQQGKDPGGQVVVAVTPTPAEQQLPTPTAVPVATPAATAIPPTPSPSPVPTPTPDPTKLALQRFGETFERIKKEGDWLGAFRLWEDVASREGIDFDRLSAQVALWVVENPRMIQQKGRRFTMGNDASDAPDQKPAHNVNVSDFAIGQFEVTALEFSTFLNAEAGEPFRKDFESRSGLTIEFSAEAKQFRPASGKGLFPCHEVSWAAADAYAQWLATMTNKAFALPTEAQWEFAAKGGSVRPFPWADGNSATAERANFNSPSVVPVNDKPLGRTPDEIYNLAGNVSEWVSDWYSEETYGLNAKETPSDPTGPLAQPAVRRPSRVNRGGGFRTQRAEEITTTSRGNAAPTAQDPEYGFRLALNSRP